MIQYLKRNKLGFATFLPMNKMKDRGVPDEVKALKSEEGVIGLALDLVSYDPQFRTVFGYVFGSTLVVKDIQAARTLGIGKARMVTQDGDIAETSGAMQGGFRRSKGTGFKENDVMKGIEEKTIAVTEESQVLSTLEQRRTENDDSITSLREKRASLEGDIIKAERSLHLDPEDMNQNSIIKEELNEQIKEVDSEIEKVEEVVSDVNGKIAKLKMDKHELRSRMNEVRSPTLLAELNAFDEKKTSLKETVLQIDADMRSVNTEINDLKLPERERIQIILKQMEKEEVSFSEEISSLGSSISDKNISLTEKEKEAEDFYAKYKGLFVQRTQIGDTITQIEHQVDIVREKSKDVEIEMNQKSIHNAEISGKLAGLEEEFRRYEGVELVDRSEEDLKSEISKFERMVIEIGNVNMRALEVYEEIQQEYNSLMNKKDVLASEKGEVIKMMDEIEHKKKALFMQSFNEINGHFKNIFGELNTKGEASLELDNPEDPLSGGLTVKVKIVGKKFMDLRSLSGGEKTMTALAFIFAIQESDPHSFYIMDEVDASLDKHNSEKLAKLIRKYTQKAQYIVISHNDAVISESDNLYGVSMNEHSISQVTTLKI